MFGENSKKQIKNFCVIAYNIENAGCFKWLIED